MSPFIQLLSSGSGLAPSDVLTIVQSAPRRYKLYYIRKRSGGRRLIAHPAREVKFLQRVALDFLLCRLPLHDAATAYRLNTSIADNAKVHKGITPIMKLDFKDFFPSIRDMDWINYCQQKGALNDEDSRLSAYLFFRQVKGTESLRLSIGAPSSPTLSNVLMYDFDQLVHREAYERGINYTRYADDMTFSGQRLGMLKDMMRIVDRARHMILMPKLLLNKNKTVFATTAYRRSVTGLILTNDGDVGLGRERRRLISASVHRAKRGLLDPDELLELCGLLAFANVAEPEFLARLSRKYGEDTIKMIGNARKLKVAHR